LRVSPEPIQVGAPLKGRHQAPCSALAYLATVLGYSCKLFV